MSEPRVDEMARTGEGWVSPAGSIVTDSAQMETEGSQPSAENAAREKTLQMRRRLGDFFERATRRFNK